MTVVPLIRADSPGTASSSHSVNQTTICWRVQGPGGREPADLNADTNPMTNGNSGFMELLASHGRATRLWSSGTEMISEVGPLWWGLEPLNTKRGDWQTRYAAVFQLNEGD
jgi:hypothetical protein